MSDSEERDSRSGPSTPAGCRSAATSSRSGTRRAPRSGQPSTISGPNVRGPGGVGLQQRYAAAWQYVARRFVNDAWVIGYDLFNEPWPAHSSDAQLGNFYKMVIERDPFRRSRPHDLLRAVCPFRLRHATTLPPWSDPDLGMSFHDYCLQGASAASGCNADRSIVSWRKCPGEVSGHG